MNKCQICGANCYHDICWHCKREAKKLLASKWKDIPSENE